MAEQQAACGTVRIMAAKDGGRGGTFSLIYSCGIDNIQCVRRNLGIGETFVLLCIYLTNTGSLAGLAVLNGTHIIIIIIIVFCDRLLLLFTYLTSQAPMTFLLPEAELRISPRKTSGKISPWRSTQPQSREH